MPYIEKLNKKYREPPKTPTAKIKDFYKEVNDLKNDAFWLKPIQNWPISSKISQCMAYIFEIYAKNIPNF